MALPPLLRLPIELHREIVDMLEFPDWVHLTLTCRYFRSVIKPPTHEDLLVTETSSWAISKKLYTCRACVRLRDLQRFTDEMRKGKRARHGVETNARFCIDCGVNQQWYTPGTTITIMGKPHELCTRCKNFPGLQDSKSAPRECLLCTRAVQEFSAGSAKRENLYHGEDDWDYSTRSFDEGRHSLEFQGAYPDL